VATEPDLERLLHRAGLDHHVVEVDAGAVMGHGLARPEAAQEVGHLLEHDAPVAGAEAESGALTGPVDAGHEGDEQPATGDLVDLGELAGQHHRVAAERHQVHAQVDLVGGAGQHGEGDDRVGRGDQRQVREPDRVEPDALGQPDERARVGGRHRDRHGEADLLGGHGPM
jgi:hypothetical protein